MEVKLFTENERLNQRRMDSIVRDVERLRKLKRKGVSASSFIVVTYFKDRIRDLEKIIELENSLPDMRVVVSARNSFLSV